MNPWNVTQSGKIKAAALPLRSKPPGRVGQALLENIVILKRHQDISETF